MPRGLQEKEKDPVNKKERPHKILYWAPRVLSILFILFISMFALDIFDMKLGFWGTIVGLFMHLMPIWIMIIALVISWKHEIVGGIVFPLLGLLYIGMTSASAIRGDLPWYLALAWSVQIAGPAIIVGVLWLVNWFWLKKKWTTKKSRHTK